MDVKLQRQRNGGSKELIPDIIPDVRISNVHQLEIIQLTPDEDVGGVEEGASGEAVDALGLRPESRRSRRGSAASL